MSTTTIEAAARSLILSDPTLSGLIGTRMYPKTLPQAPTLPAIRYHNVGGPGRNSHSGATGYRRTRLQLDCVAATPDEAQTVRDAVRRLADGYRGEVSGVRLFDVQADDMPDDHAADTGRYSCILDLRLGYRFV